MTQRLLHRSLAPHRRSGFSLLELITAMVASTVLVASLAATVLISTRLLETPPDDAAAWQDRLIADRLAGDLRYATSIDQSPASGFQLTRTSVDGVSPQSLAYESSMDGFTRQVDSETAIVFDAQSPSQTFLVDGYSAPTTPASTQYVRVRSSNTAASGSAVSTLNISVPPACVDGDEVILCLSAKSPSSISISGGGWQTLQGQGIADLRLVVVHRTFDVSWSDTIQITATPDSAMAAAMVAIEHTDPSGPVDWSGGNGGFALTFLPASIPQPLETSGFDPRQLNLQVFAADLDPWTDGALGLAGFTDVAQATAAAGNFSIENTVAIAVRNDQTPSMTNSPSLLHQVSGFWLQAAVRLEAKP